MHLKLPLGVLAAVATTGSLVLAPPVAAEPTSRSGDRMVAFTAVARGGEAARLSTLDRDTAEHHRVAPVVTAATPAIAVGEGVSAIGVTWSGGPPRGVVQWRFRAPGSVPGAWAELPTGSHGPDAGSAEARASRRASEPVLTTDSGAVELRVIGEESATTSLMATVDDVDGATAPGSSSPGSRIGAESTTALTSGTTPTILTRAAWGADESVRRGSPSYGAVKGEVVHHTVNANSYAAAEVPAIIRGIYAYHVNRNGWNDLGYNFLIDRFGRIWEGRHGGTDRPVVGAHSPGVNSWTTSAAAIGTYTSSATPVPAAVTTAYQNLFTWKARLHQIEPDWTVNLGGTTQRSISGHRDNTSTECPGAALYAKVPSIMSATSAATPNSPALTVRRDADNAGGNDVLTSDERGRLAVVTADGSGALQPPQTKTTLNPAGFDMMRVAGDWNGDGAVDVVGRLRSNGSLYLHPGDGAGGFTAPVRIGVGWGSIPLMTTVGDITGDRHPDIVAASTDAFLRVYPGNGKGGFLPPRVIGTGWHVIRSIVGIGDWDRDGDADLLGITTAGAPKVYRNLGDGRLTKGPQLNFTAQAPAVVSAVGDVTSDTLNDLVVKDVTGRVRVAASTADAAVVRWVEQSPETVSTWRGLTPHEG